MKNALMIFGLVGLMTTTSVMAQSPAVTNIVETNDSVASFCRDRLYVLKAAYRQAEIESQAGNFEVSASILENSLRTAAAQVQPRFASTLTAKAIKRGLILLSNMKATAEHRQKARTINHFLFNYFVFIESVSNRLDIPFFQVGNGGFSRISASNTMFEKLFVNFAEEQVKMVLDSMSTTVNEDRTSVIYPVGSPTLLLIALKVSTAAMASDLRDSIFAARYACTIQYLEFASQNIKNYLDYGTTYADDYTAVQELVGAVKRATGRECHAGNVGYEPQQPKTVDAINSPITLYAGTTHQVRLSGERFIKKLIISAEGIRNDAMFDVVVNGDIKGTIYVPGRDPSYFVTVEDYTDSIEFVSRNGNATISKILVVAE